MSEAANLIFETTQASREVGITYEVPVPGYQPGQGGQGSVNDGIVVSDPTTAQGDFAIASTIFGITFDENATNTGSYFIPPDPHGAVGLTHVVSVTNTSIEWHLKDGTQQSSQSLQNFFGAATFTFDPKVVYDQYNDRFVVVTLERVNLGNGNTTDDESRILVAVSDDSDPNGTWHTHTINALTTIGGVNAWADYPGLAIDDEAIYITNNMFQAEGAGSFAGNRLWIVAKGDGTGGLYDGGAASVNIYDPPGASGGFELTMMPTQMYGTAPGTTGTFLVGYNGLSDGTNEYYQVIRVDNALGTPSFTSQFVLLGDIEGSPSLEAYNDAPQSGTATLIETNDRRLYDAVWRDGSIYGTTTVVGTGAEAGQITAYWAEISTSNLASLSLVQGGKIGGEDIAAGAFTFFPSIAVNADGDVGIGFSASAPSIFGGSYFTWRDVADPLGTVRATQTVKTGEDYYIRTFGGSRNRWGDYSATVVDPSDDQTFWTFNEYAMTRGTLFGGEDGRWATVWGKFSELPADDFGETAGTAGAVAVGGTATGELEITGDLDWFAVPLVAGGNYRISVLGSDNAGGTLGDPLLDGVYDPTEMFISGTSDDNSGAGNDAALYFTATSTGTHFLSAGGAAGQIGTYTVAVTQDDHREDTATLGVLTGGSASGSIETNGDKDWFKVALTGGVTYIINLEGVATGGGTLIDPYFNGVYDASGTLIINTNNDDGGIGLNSQKLFTAASSGDYFLAAAAFGGTGTYTISLVAAPPSVELLDGASSSVGTFVSLGEALLSASDGYTLVGIPGTYALFEEQVTVSLDDLTFDLPADTKPVIVLNESGQRKLTVTGSGSANVVGNAEANAFVGGNQNDVLYGNAGNDLLIGGPGDDYIDGGSEDDTIFNSVATPTTFDGTNWGWSWSLVDGGNDSIDGGPGTDRAYLVYDRPENIEVIINGGGFSTILSNGVSAGFLDSIEAITFIGGSGNDLVIGGALEDFFTGRGGTNTFAGNGSADTAYMGTGDTIFDGGDGLDTADYSGAASGVTVSLLINGPQATGVSTDTLTSVENLTGSAFADDLYGRGGANVLIGLAGDDLLRGSSGDDYLDGGPDNDQLRGQGGADEMHGGTGDDEFYVDHVGDTVFENPGEGDDIIFTRIDYTAPANVERIAIVIGPRTISGNELDNRVIGNAGSDTLSGLDGNDVINGKGGRDIIFGGNDNDTIYPGEGKDEMTGGAGADQFRFQTLLDSWNTTSLADIIHDFNGAEGDRIYLNQIDADSTTPGTNDAFTWIDTAAFSGTPGELRQEVLGPNTYAMVDVDGDTVVDMYIRFDGVVTLVEANFVL